MADSQEPIYSSYRHHTRRQFILGGLAALALTSCGKPNVRPIGSAISTAIENLTPEQKRTKRQGRSAVALVKSDSYENDLFALAKPYLDKLNLPNFKGKNIVLKPNMIEVRPGIPITTNPRILELAVLCAQYLGAASITVAEGAGHFRDTDYLLKATGVGDICHKYDLPFVDLNLDELVEIPNKHGFTRLKKFILPKTVMEADIVISVPKMKTHHWVGVTCSMKNMFGTAPGPIYGWPKNLLHKLGIALSIVDLVRLTKPQVAFVDGIVAMEGDGPVNGKGKASNVFLIGNDLAATDATCARLMGVDFADLGYIRLAGEVIGNIQEKDIDLIGASLEELKQKFALPITFTDKSLLALGANGGS